MDNNYKGFPEPPKGPVNFNHPIYEPESDEDTNSPHGRFDPIMGGYDPVMGGYDPVMANNVPYGDPYQDEPTHQDVKPPPFNFNQQVEDEGEGYEEQDEVYEEKEVYRDTRVIGAGFKLVGIIALVVIIFMVGKFWKDKKEMKSFELEKILKMNPTGGVKDNTRNNNIVGYTPRTDSPSDIDSINYSNEAYTEVVTEIMKYTKGIMGDGRTFVTLESENYGKYDIYIPYSRYTTLDSKGYLLVDMEIVDNEVKFLYISNKQDNLNQLLNNN